MERMISQIQPVQRKVENMYFLACIMSREKCYSLPSGIRNFENKVTYNYIEPDKYIKCLIII